MDFYGSVVRACPLPLAYGLALYCLIMGVGPAFVPVQNFLNRRVTNDRLRRTIKVIIFFVFVWAMSRGMLMLSDGYDAAESR